MVELQETMGTYCFQPLKTRWISHTFCTFESVWWVSRILYKGFFPLLLISNTSAASFSAYVRNRRCLFLGRDTAWSVLPGFERSLNSSCQSGACISCFRFFPGGFDVNPFHTSNTSVLLQAFLSFLSIQIYMWGEKLLAVIVQFLKWDFNDKAHFISPYPYSVLTTQDAACELQFF